MTLIEVFVVIIVLVVLAAMLLPLLTHPGTRKPIACIDNLRQIGLSFHVWAGDNYNKYPMQVSVTNGGAMELVTDGKNVWPTFQVMSNELVTTRVLVCPADNSRVAATNFSNDFNNGKISYFVGLDADPSSPRAFLSGDDNFAISGELLKSGLLQLTPKTPVTWAATRHVKVGNVVLDDGSVQMLNTPQLPLFLQATGLATNRLAIP